MRTKRTTQKAKERITIGAVVPRELDKELAEHLSISEEFKSKSAFITRAIRNLLDKERNDNN